MPVRSFLGIRNILVRDFRMLNLRPDKGGVFENFIVSEIFKRIKNNNLLYELYFYREYGGREIDFVLENYKKEYFCFESKYKAKSPLVALRKIFPLPHDFKVIDAQNYFKLLTAI